LLFPFFDSVHSTTYEHEAWVLFGGISLHIGTVAGRVWPLACVHTQELRLFFCLQALTRECCMQMPFVF
jgi:hypothetical protein